MGLADIQDTVGDLGKFQAIHVFLMAFPALFMASHNLLQNFVAAVPDHRCRVRPGANGTRSLNATEEPLSEELLRVFVPLDREGRPNKCLLYTSPQWQLLGTNETWGNRSQPDTQACTDGWVYDRSQFTATIVTEWDLVCGQKSLKRMTQSIYMAGLLIGAIVLGRLSDMYGRRALLLWSSFQLAVSGTCAMFSSSLALFCFWRFLCGVGIAGVIANTYFFAIEWIPTRIRSTVVMGMSYMYSLGELVLAGVAFQIRDWRWLQFTVSLPFYVIFLYSWWFSESARWLIVNGKAEAALKQLRRVAKMNGREAEGEKLTVEILKSSLEEDLSNSKDSYGALDLFRTPGLRRISCCIMFVWFSVSFSFYGLVIDLQGLGTDIYLIQVIFGVVDIPFLVITLILVSYVGRCITEGTCLIVAGTIVLTNIFIPKELQGLRTFLAAVGKGCLGAAFSTLFLHTPELYPTVVRLTGMGLATTMARTGAIIAPIIKIIGDHVPFLPMAMYGGMAVTAGIAAFSLPETRNTQLPDTVVEVERRVAERTKKLKKSKKEDSTPGGRNITDEARGPTHLMLSTPLVSAQLPNDKSSFT